LENFLPREGSSEFFLVLAKTTFSRETTNSSKFSFHQHETKIKTFFYQKVNTKISQYKAQGSWPSCTPIPTPMLICIMRASK